MLGAPSVSGCLRVAGSPVNTGPIPRRGNRRKRGGDKVRKLWIGRPSPRKTDKDATRPDLMTAGFDDDDLEAIERAAG